MTDKRKKEKWARMEEESRQVLVMHESLREPNAKVEEYCEEIYPGFKDAPLNEKLFAISVSAGWPIAYCPNMVADFSDTGLKRIAEGAVAILKCGNPYPIPKHLKNRLNVIHQIN